MTVNFIELPRCLWFFQNKIPDFLHTDTWSPRPWFDVLLYMCLLPTSLFEILPVMFIRKAHFDSVERIHNHNTVSISHFTTTAAFAKIVLKDFFPHTSKGFTQISRLFKVSKTISKFYTLRLSRAVQGRKRKKMICIIPKLLEYRTFNTWYKLVINGYNWN